VNTRACRLQACAFYSNTGRRSASNISAAGGAELAA
jgi:hypothetical protein